MIIRLPITPIGYLRRTRQGRYQPAAMAYHRYLNDVRTLMHTQYPGVTLPDALGAIAFYLPMPPSWSMKKKEAMAYTQHQQKPDLDNLVKALFDALRPGNDQRIHCYGPVWKCWCHGDGSIRIECEPEQGEMAYDNR